MKVKYQPVQTAAKIKKEVFPDKLEGVISVLEAEQLVKQGDAEFPNNEPAYLDVFKKDKIVTYVYRKYNNTFFEIHDREYPK